ncbi:DUF498 domain-containing protein [Plectosphaerella cucumerina]|uniref:DUF498 domain-containing protein n=1 Tax=Plectosphaerella cucumerina TaxID=40658 RepID=A0A8K0TC70_9PEZI|nr:DUF498 domain-containing protein [Plectosphaerella cucumerina]
MSLSSPLRVMRAIPRSRQALLPTTSRSIAVLPAASRRAFHAAPTLLRSRSQNNSKEHRPADLASLDVLASAPVPSTNIDATLPRGFMFNSGLSILDGAGALLVGGEAFEWKPWLLNGPEDDPKNLRIVNSKGQIELPAEAFSLLSLVWPRPDLFVIGVGRLNRPLSPETRRHISALGMRVEVLDTRNACSHYNLLTTERGVEEVGAALIPIGWVEGKGAVE